MSISVKNKIFFTDIKPSFAKQFISRKLEEFTDPVRTGKSRGSAIGLNRVKYSAALFMAIYELNTADVETILDVPRSLVSKWRTEKMFTREMEHLLGEFVSEFDQNVNSGYDEKLFEDAAHYNKNLKLQIIGLCDAAVVRQDHDSLFKYWPLLKVIYFIS